jgi:hypothetical protein
VKKAKSAILRSYDDPIRSARLPTSVNRIMTRFAGHGPVPESIQRHHLGTIWYPSVERGSGFVSAAYSARSSRDRADAWSATAWRIG